ncbi:hypothetical protein D3C84_799560 [compost metagenome]
MNDLFLVCPAQRAVPSPANQRVRSHGKYRNDCEQRAVGNHEDECRDGHQTIQERRKEGGCQCPLYLADSTEPRDDIAKVALFKVLDRQPEQVTVNVRPPLHAQQGTHVHHHPSPCSTHQLLHQK